MEKHQYVLITPARNEEQYIETTIKAVVGQTYRPKRWIIVSDGSTDRTDEIVKDYAAQYPFIRLLRREAEQRRNFSSKVYAFKSGISLISDIEYDYIGIVDADYSFSSDYYLQILQRFEQMPQLGLAGGLAHEPNKQNKWIPIKKISYDWNVAGGVQLFRREVYESIGGYLPLSRGGEDAISGVMVRMKGWEVRTFCDIHVFHHRTMGTAETDLMKAKFKQGIMEYTLGYHSLFQLARFFSWMLISPLASVYRTAGYVYAMLKRMEHVVPAEVIEYMRKEQMQRLKNSLPWRKNTPE